MSSIFSAPNKLRSTYYEAGFATVSGKNLANAHLLAVLRVETTLFSIYNGCNTDLYVALVNPKDETQTKLAWTVLEQGQSFNLDAMGGRMLTFPAETKIYIHTNGVAAASGKVRALIWG
jgi:hypothetical protein